MKKLLTLALALLMFAAIPLSSAASTADVSRELINIQASYKEKLTLTRAEETLAMASMEWLTGRTAYYPESDGTADTLDYRVLTSAATQDMPEGFSDPETLAGLQKTDGSFGSLETHCIAIIALRSTQTSFNSPGAYKYLLSQQKENGTFGNTMKETALAVAALSLSENQSELNALSATMNYLATYKTDDIKDLCWQIIALTDCGVNAVTTGDTTRLERLLSHQNGTGAFSLTPTGTESDEETTVLALLALDTINRDSSAYKRIATEGLLKRYSIEDFRSLLIFLGALLAISIVFWIYVIVHKKNNKTLEETKLY